MSLDTRQQATVSRADAARLARVFADLVGNWQNGRWLTASNRYAVNCVGKIKEDTIPVTGRLRHRHLASYIAASSVVHCMDGWSYISRAIEAELSGDIDAARHLAYYAELRAAMSLLAGAGVGVFDRKHFAVRADKRCEPIAGSTHVFVWDALEYWAQQPTATDLILSVIQPGGKALSEWLDYFPPTAGGAFRGVLAQQWLLNWGLDLRRLASDRKARNESSYRPTNIMRRRHPTLNQSLDFIKDLWRAHEPSDSNPFRELDRHLLRRSLASAFKANHARNHNSRRAPVQFARLIEPALHGALPTPGDFTEAEWREFLNYRAQQNDNQVIIQAEKVDPVSSPLHHIQVIARATLLLRIATGAIRHSLQGLHAPDVANLSFWWRPIGETRGLWETGAPPAQFSDLWQDVDASLDQLQAWRDAGGNSKRGLYSGAAEVIRSLSSCERVALWSLGL